MSTRPDFRAQAEALPLDCDGGPNLPALITLLQETWRDGRRAGINDAHDVVQSIELGTARGSAEETILNRAMLQITRLK